MLVLVLESVGTAAVTQVHLRSTNVRELHSPIGHANPGSFRPLKVDLIILRGIKAGLSEECLLTERSHTGDTVQY